MRPIRRLLAAAMLVLAAAALFAACNDDESDDATPTPDEPVDATPGAAIAETGSLLFDARSDLAARLGTDTRDVILLRVQHAGFDGCLGLYKEDEPCIEQFIGGYIAYFSADEEEYRYHFGNGEFLAVDFLEGEVDDGLDVPVELRTDFHRVLAAYALHDAALREGEDVSGYIISAIVPTAFPNGCLGFERPDQSCDDAITPGAIVLLRSPGGGTLTYHISDAGHMVATDFEDGEVTVEPDEEVVAVQQAMREDLAERTGSPLNEVTMIAFREVTWRDGCLGVAQPGQVCTQALVDGFLAFLTDGSGEEYRYHGSGSDFIAASFQDDAIISDPLPPEGPAGNE